MAESSPILGVLLAGGRASRMGGGDKCLARLAGKPLVAWSIERLGPQVTALVLNANGDVHRFDAFGLPVIADYASRKIGDFAGPLAGVLAGMIYARAKAPQAAMIVTAATDTPFLPLDLVEKLKTASGGERLAVARSATGVHPVFGLWPLKLADDLRSDLEGGKRKVRDWVAAKGATEVGFPPERIGKATVDPFFNINRPEDLVQAEALLRTGR
jgi:molybdopterin-guanine dinucleotide biosynthesis protein A